jgi:predicted dienelactone hydrolase
VVIAQGNGQSAKHQAVLAEYLASHGYVVATSPSPLRLGARMESEADVLPVAREQARDMTLVVREMRKRLGRASVEGPGHWPGGRRAVEVV